MKKEILFIGLGRMGQAMAMRLVEKGYKVHGYDVSEEACINAQSGGVITYKTLFAGIEALKTPRTVFIMVPSLLVEDTLTELRTMLSAFDTIIDGGNSFFKESIARHDLLSSAQIGFIDCGTSGGIAGARNGAALMVGGEAKLVSTHENLFRDLAAEKSYAHVGGPGAGHFVKMVHNAIEYGMMGAIAEGVNVLNEHKDDLHIDVEATLTPYEHGSIIEGKLMSWLSLAFIAEGYLENIAGVVPKGETEIEMEYLIENAPMPVLGAALLQRKQTRTKPSFIGVLISAMRNQFGGHAVIEKK